MRLLEEFYPRREKAILSLAFPHSAMHSSAGTLNSQTLDGGTSFQEIPSGGTRKGKIWRKKWLKMSNGAQPGLAIEGAFEQHRVVKTYRVKKMSRTTQSDLHEWNSESVLKQNTDCPIICAFDWIETRKREGEDFCDCSAILPIIEATPLPISDCSPKKLGKCNNNTSFCHSGVKEGKGERGRPDRRLGPTIHPHRGKPDRRLQYFYKVRLGFAACGRPRPQTPALPSNERTNERASERAGERANSLRTICFYGFA